MRLMDVVDPGSEGTGMVEGVTSAQFATFNEFPLTSKVVRGLHLVEGLYCNK